MCRGQFHCHRYSRGAGIEGAAENSRETKHIIYLVGKIAAAGCNNSGTTLEGFFGEDLGGGIGKREDDRVLRHDPDIVGMQECRFAYTNKYISFLQRIMKAAFEIAQI